VREKIFLGFDSYRIYSIKRPPVKRRPQLSAAYESENIKERHPRISAAFQGRRSVFWSGGAENERRRRELVGGSGGILPTENFEI